MYNTIPSERTSKRAIVVALLCCITLVSVLAAGYFAWMAKNLQQRLVSDAQLQEIVEQQSEAPANTQGEFASSQYDFVYPEIIQPPKRTEAPEGMTLLSAELNDWQEANKYTGYCLHVNEYAESEDIRNRYSFPVQEGLADAGVRSALLSYFQVKSGDKEEFFAGIDQAADTDDQFSMNGNMCSGGGRTFLLLDDVHDTTNAEGNVSTDSFPEVLEWAERGTTGFAWTFYPVGAYRIMDGYTFIPDWYGNVIVQTGYGDAGYAHWEIQSLETTGGVPALNMLEKCNLEPTADYSDSITTCAVEYHE